MCLLITQAGLMFQRLRRMLIGVLCWYIIREEGRPWVLRTICDLWRLHKSRTKAKHYTAYTNDEDRIANKPDKIPLEEFKELLEYWADEHTQSVAATNSKSRRSITETHTAGTTSFAQVRNEMKLKDPEKVSPTKAQVYIETRKRNPEKEYKTPTDVINSKLSKSDALFSEDEISHAPSWLIGRHAKTAKEKQVGKDDYVQQLTSEIRKELAAEMEEKVNKKVQENMRRVLKKLGEANPSFNLDVEELYSTDYNDVGTLVTPATTPATTAEGNGATGDSS